MRLRALAVAAALVAVGGVARADAFDHIGDGAPLYVAARPIALVGAMQRMGLDQLPAMQRLKRNLGGIDPFNPAILSAPGIDVAAPLVLSIFEPAGAGLAHTRIAATLRDPQTFTTFIDAVAASGQVKLQHVDGSSPLGKLGVVATGNLAPDMTVVIRVHESDAVVDVVNGLDGKKTPAPAELARRFAMTPAHAFSVAHGARRLFAPEAAAVAYVDGRHMAPLFQTMMAQEAQVELRWVQPSQKAAMLAKQRARDKRCAVWTHAPATFDDLALALTATPEGLALTLAWGTESGEPLGGLKLHPVDDAGLDAELLGRDATAVLALYAASLQPFVALKRAPPFHSSDAFYAAFEGCSPIDTFHLVVRSWPLALGILGATKTTDASSPLASVQRSVGQLRNIVIALRDLTQQGPRGAVAATFDAAARPTVEMLLAAGGGTGAVTTIGKRSPTVYALTLPGFPRQLAAALESLAAGRFGATVADSDESLTWAFRAGAMPTSAPEGAAHAPPILRVAADLATLPKLGPMLNAGRDEQQMLELLARLRRVDGELVADGDLLRLTLRSPLKQ